LKNILKKLNSKFAKDKESSEKLIEELKDKCEELSNEMKLVFKEVSTTRSSLHGMRIMEKRLDILEDLFSSLEKSKEREKLLVPKKRID